MSGYCGSCSASLVAERALLVRSEVFDALGRRVAVVFDGEVPAGAYTPLTFDSGALRAGPYFLRVTGEFFAGSARLSIVR